ncbi:MAG: hypothetical protein L0I76_32415, partial [Pseudonocardia sp.]|nr:hypothetical protein [Pseudonocardia sp.]
TGYTYGALAAPIAFLLAAFFIGFAVVIGAHFNASIQYFRPVRLKDRRGTVQQAIAVEPATTPTPTPASDTAPTEPGTGAPTPGAGAPTAAVDPPEAPTGEPSVPDTRANTPCRAGPVGSHDVVRGIATS